MLACGTYKVWGTSPTSSAPSTSSKPDGYLIVARNDDGSRSCYWVPLVSFTFPFVADTSLAYWFWRADEPEGVGEKITSASLDTTIPPCTHDWEDWSIEINGTPAGAMLSLQTTSNLYKTYTGLESTLGYPIELGDSTWLTLIPLGNTRGNAWLEDYIDAEFPGGSLDFADHEIS